MSISATGGVSRAPPSTLSSVGRAPPGGGGRGAGVGAAGGSASATPACAAQRLKRISASGSESLRMIAWTRCAAAEIAAAAGMLAATTATSRNFSTSS